MRLPRHWQPSIAALIGLGIAAASVSFYPRQLSAHPFFGQEQHTMIDKINDASLHRYPERFGFPAWIAIAESDLRSSFRGHLSESFYRETIAENWCSIAYQRFDARVIHSYGLTDPILARANVPFDRPAHKLGLLPLARDLRAIVARAGNTTYLGMYREYVELGIAPQWIAANLESIEAIERKSLNRHRLLENLHLAFTFPDRLEIPEKRLSGR